MRRFTILNVILKLLVIFGVFTLSSCGRWTFDSTGNSQHWGGYKQNGIYRLNFDVFMIKKSWMSHGPSLALVPAASVKRSLGRFYFSPYSINTYKKEINNTGKSDSRVRGIVTKGTQLKVFRLDRHEQWSFWFGRTTSITIVARVMNGAFANSIVDMRDVSIYYKQEGDKFFKYKPEEIIFDSRYFTSDTQ